MMPGWLFVHYPLFYHLSMLPLFNKETELHLTKTLLQTLATSKREGETVTDFQDRIENEIKNIMK